MKHILGFDIGNTNTTLGIYNINQIVPEKIYTYQTEKKITSNELEILIQNFLNIYTKEINIKLIIQGIVFSSVVTEINNQYNLISKNLYNLKALEINSYINLGITLMYDNPAELGADRIANAVCAFKEYKKDCIIISLGTANTFSIIHKNGIFDGGMIGPGFGIMMEALAEKTSKLSLVGFEKPQKFIATSTIDAIKSGYFYGSISLLNGLIKKIEDEYKKNFLIILTGGFSKKISSYLEKENILDPFLTMKGIKYIYDMNCR